ncbi:DUF692 domain-containing protein [Orrella dioscoreae]|uniref:DUF692 domain-containing protein n=1 Tax=Orrella dioscoreae TaxID=1851544 RepID=UPI000AFA2D80|nr:DUF692 family multinuclear iron-containing protein [Orrella dioscoreae]
MTETGVSPLPRRRAAAIDRVGMGWRPALAAGIQQHRARIDVLEVIADDWFDAPAGDVRALASLAARVPVVLHAVGLGLASAHPVDSTRLADMARLVEAVRPLAWSEHLAFVRADGIEIGHLAAPPRTAATVAGTLENLSRARAVVGSLPWLENIASLVAPPASSLPEADWVSAILAGSGARLLLDLHNLYANALNAGRDPITDLEALPLDRVACVHVSGGRWVDAPGASTRRLLDDHLHDPPEAMTALLAHLAALTPQPLTVILERDGRYPDMAVLLDQLDALRAALASGRAQGRAAAAPPPGAGGIGVAPDLQAGQRLESLLARVYGGHTDCQDFLRDPQAAALAAGCAPADAEQLMRIDRDGLLHAVHSFGHKRAARARPANH